MSTVSNSLDAFINPNDSQINQIAPPQLTTSKRITSILDVGILSANELNQNGLAFEAGYDAALNDVVFLNIITKVQGVAKAVFSSADGIFAVCMERDTDQSFINGLIQEEELEQKFQEKL